MSERFTLRSAWALGLLSVSVIACQLALMQILAYVQWYHFAYMVISIAMLGFGAAGTVIALFKEKLLRHKNTLLPALAIASGLMLELALRLTSSKYLVFDLYHLFVDNSQFWKLAANFFIYFLPFFFAALAIGIIFTAWVSEIGKLYFANLFGSGLGGLIALVLLSLILPWHAFTFCAFLAILSGLLMIKKARWKFAAALTGAVVLVFSCSLIWPYQIKPSQYKSLSKTLNLTDAEIIYQEPGIYGLNQVVTSPVLRYAPGVGLSYEGEIPVKPAVFTNAGFTGVLSKNWNREPHPANFTTFALPFVLCEPDTVLVLNAGTGYFVAHALRQGASHIAVTEPNRKLVQLMQNNLADASGFIYNQPNVDVHTIEARTYLSLTAQQYDLAIMPVMDAFGGTSGLYAMQENYTLTVEGVNQIWQQLKPGGCLSISTWLDYPVRTPLKIANTLMEVLNINEAAEPKQHIAVVKSWGTITFVISKSPLTNEQIAATRSFCETFFFDPVLLPGVTTEERNRYNAFGDPSFFIMLDDIVAGNRSWDDYLFYIEPSTDNRPYFNHFVRLKNLPALSGSFDQETMPFLELGYIIVIVTLVQVTLMALLFILVPLFRLRTQKGARLPVVLYFASLGLGYMFIEIILIQRFIHYFGTPVIAASVVISVMMMASGAGSYLSGNFRLSKPLIRLIPAIVTVCGILLLIGLNPLIRATGGLGIYFKAIIAFFVIAIPAFFMGMPFPLGLKAISRHHQSLVPWAWGINGCLSVIASPLAVLIAAEAGFTWVMAVAAIVYFLAMMVAGKLLLGRTDKLNA
ncbi:MAG TPA: class I SAM-dependent methyltransferase [Bacteroidales bacterium]|nr:class I SAM-dependent methyltransferase [Bacteroidales bacterium]